MRASGAAMATISAISSITSSSTEDAAEVAGGQDSGDRDVRAFGRLLVHRSSGHRLRQSPRPITGAYTKAQRKRGPTKVGTTSLSIWVRRSRGVPGA